MKRAIRITHWGRKTTTYKAKAENPDKNESKKSLTKNMRNWVPMVSKNSLARGAKGK